ncbi:hypothetical protein JW859_00800 [bacterium]|nr:hypothetical protein [bacterium]
MGALSARSALADHYYKLRAQSTARVAWQLAFSFPLILVAAMVGGFVVGGNILGWLIGLAVAVTIIWINAKSLFRRWEYQYYWQTKLVFSSSWLLLAVLEPEFLGEADYARIRGARRFNFQFAEKTLLDRAQLYLRHFRTYISAQSYRRKCRTGWRSILTPGRLISLFIVLILVGVLVLENSLAILSLDTRFAWIDSFWDLGFWYFLGGMLVITFVGALVALGLMWLKSLSRSTGALKALYEEVSAGRL